MSLHVQQRFPKVSATQQQMLQHELRTRMCVSSGQVSNMSAFLNDVWTRVLFDPTYSKMESLVVFFAQSSLRCTV